ncbi:1-phosphatidylinositol 4,5-bisphosphate phosphodiesterase delta-3-like isoform X2 [Pristis pectinata]|nr:1-phosphatidylinositol 4,5-bisphosphate phosphodiesterase delta-3-like isoform X2 [Pristis pectinata]XP_051894870.1 1-phosphatidylinositol 4,5-bisphosphate phosphodiesterase delta-3-like isoform X2 [Pristis pectinata]XP_051894871.1 1-phosphatidylinositol 4,5-bisphosphate phosphodiesterase delta-3-like isoform X2 [Pristis pectinata]
MLRGSKLRKVKSSKWKKDRQMKLQEDGLSIWYESRNKPPTFSVMDIQDVQEGHQSEVMTKHGSSFSEKRCFTIVFAGSRSSLDLVAASEEEGRRWVQGLKKLTRRVATMSQQDKIEHLIHQHLHKADKNNDNKISFKEMKNMLKMINLKVNDDYVNFLFQQCDKSKTNKLEEHEIEEFCKLLMQRPELEQIFQHFSGKEQRLTIDGLELFLKEQKEMVTKENCLNVMQKYGLHDNGKLNQALTLDGFMMYLLSPEGNIFNPDHDQVYQDMTQPLSHYFISTSHNTYLMEDQLGGPSSTEAYIRALLRGCRCVELDCWEGPNGEPIIYHGYTLTSKILFKSVITTIRDYAFTVSPYPVILSLENHCGKEQQAVMARHLKGILGDMLVTATIDGKDPKELPSPEELKRKILIKGKKLRNSGPTAVPQDEAADDCEEENVKNEKKNKKKLTRELSDLVIYCQSTHFQSFEQTWSRQTCHETSSFSETKAKRLIAENGFSFVTHNTLQLSKVYPLGSRVDSSNFNPQEMWNGGCQLVALNFQKPGMEMDLNKGKFRQNGRSGYILKPSFMRNRSIQFDPSRPTEGSGLDRKQLIIDVITAQQLPKVNKDKKNSIVDPLVRVEVHGVPEDNATKRTRHIENNGFNPMWNETLQFTISVPELALIRFLVEDYDSSSSNDFIGQFTVPFTSVKEGYRHIHLLARDSAPLSPATLFVRVRIKSV